MLIVLDDYDFNELFNAISNYGSVMFSFGLHHDEIIADSFSEDSITIFDSIEHFLKGKVINNETCE